MGRFRDTVLVRLKRIKEGKEKFIPNPHGRMAEVFNIYKRRYILIGSNTGIGKSAFIDDTFLLRPYEWLLKQDFKYHYEVQYYSMERTETDKYVKWLSWKVYESTGIINPSDKFQNCTQEEAEKYEAIAEKYEPWADALLDKVTVKQGPRDVEEISADIEAMAKRLCYHIKSDDQYIYVDGVKRGEFSPDKVKETNKGKIMYKTVFLSEDSRDISPNEEFWSLKLPNTFAFIIIDHIGKTKKGSEMIQKGAIDKLDAILAAARDKYEFIPIVISQFNRAIGDFDRIRISKGDLSPILEDFKDSSNTQESADLVIAPFDPYRYNSYDKEGNYRGYNLTPGMLTPSGNCRFRSLHFLKHSNGTANISFGMKFLGEIMHFRLLPPANSTELNKVYQEIAQGK